MFFDFFNGIDPKRSYNLSTFCYALSGYVIGVREQSPCAGGISLELLPVQQSHGTFTVSPGSVAGTSRVVLQTTFVPLDATAGKELSGAIEGAFGQSLQSLRRYVEEKVPWDA